MWWCWHHKLLLTYLFIHLFIYSNAHFSKIAPHFYDNLTPPYDILPWVARGPRPLLRHCSETKAWSVTTHSKDGHGWIASPSTSLKLHWLWWVSLKQCIFLHECLIHNLKFKVAYRHSTRGRCGCFHSGWKRVAKGPIVNWGICFEWGSDNVRQLKRGAATYFHANLKMDRNVSQGHWPGSVGFSSF